MVQRKVEWSESALNDLLAIMNYYSNRNKSKAYSQNLSKEIGLKLKTINFSVAMPKKTSEPNLFYFTQNHITVCFEISDNNLKVQIVIDDRRNPELIEKLLQSIH